MLTTAAEVVLITTFVLATITANPRPTRAFWTAHTQAIVFVRISPQVFTGSSLGVITMF